MPIMNIKALREAKGLTQRDLGNAMGVDVSTVTKWETEVALPKARDLPRLSRVLGCSISALFVAEEDPEGQDYDTTDEE